MSNEQPFLPQAIGARLRELRSEIGWTQENVASVARTLGLEWTRPTVTAIEAGDRALTLEEFFCLPVVYPTLKSLADLFSEDQQHEGLVTLHLAERSHWMTPEWHLRKLLTGGKHQVIDPAEAGVNSAGGAPAEDEARSGSAMGQIRAGYPRPARWWLVGGSVVTGSTWNVPHTKVTGDWDDPAERAYQALPWNLKQRSSEIEIAAKGDAERKAARKFGVSPELVSVVAFTRYSRSLSEERDMRVVETMPKGATNKTMQALRGHITRAILAEMKNMIEHYKRLRWDEEER